MKVKVVFLIAVVVVVGCSLVESGPQPAQPTAPPVWPTSTFAPTREPIGALNLPGRLVYSQGVGGLWETNLQSGEQRQLWQPPAGGYLKDVAVAPDGTRFALTYAPPSNMQYYSDLYLASADGSEITPLLAGADDTEIFESPAWSPDGAWIYYGHIVPIYDEEGNYQSTHLNVERVAAEGTAEPEIIIEGGHQPSLSADGQRLVYLRYEESRLLGLWIANADGTEARELVPASAFLAIAMPRLSPDGTAVAFAASRVEQTPAASAGRLAGMMGVKTAFAHGLPWGIWRVPAAGGTPEQVTTMVMDTPSLAWSPNGAHLAMMQPGGLFLLDTADPRFLGPVQNHGSLEWAE